MNLRKFLSVVFFSALATIGAAETTAQSRPRIALTNPVKKTISSQPTNLPPTIPNKIQQISYPVLTSRINLVQTAKSPVALVKKTISSQPLNAPKVALNTAPVSATDSVSSLSTISSSPLMAAAASQRLTAAMDARLGIRYVYGSNGPNTYDCSSLVWSVFREAGFDFERTSARNYWHEFEPVSGDDRFQFGTLVFFNDLGHVGIVVNDKGFYHASSSKGVTYSSFDGYWEKRIVGFRRIPASLLNNLQFPEQK